MSLIVDIDPVPWNILEVVKCRILKNRAKAKRAVENCGGSEEKRADSLRPGPLSIRRKDEPSFVLSGKTPYIAIRLSGQPMANGQNFVEFYTPNTAGPSYYPLSFLPYYNVYQIWAQPEPHIFKLNGVVVGEIVPPSTANTWVAYLFIWSDNIETQKELINSDKTFVSGKTSVNAFRYDQADLVYGLIPSPFYTVPIIFNWIVVVIDNNVFAEPQPGDKVEATFEPKSTGIGGNQAIVIGFTEDKNSVGSPGFNTFSPIYDFVGRNYPGITETKTYTWTFPDYSE